MHPDAMPSHEVPRQVPTGFSSITDLNRACRTNHPETAQQYKAKGLLVQTPGEFAQNNGVLVLVDFEGNMRAMIPISDPERQKESMARFEKARADLKSMGYVESSFMVPFSNPVYERWGN